MIVVVSSVGDFWVEDRIANQIAKAIQDEVKHITICGSIIATNSIRGLLKSEQYRQTAMQQKRSWICEHGKVIDYNGVCRCKLDVLLEESKRIESKAKPTEEDNLRAEASREWIKICKKNWELMKNKQKRADFVEKYIVLHKNVL